MKKLNAVKELPALADQPARDRIRDDLDTTLVVEAAAGTGKTTALIGRILSGIISGRVSLAKTVAVTFTDFAAGELKLRLRLAIEAARQQHDLFAANNGVTDTSGTANLRRLALARSTRSAPISCGNIRSKQASIHCLRLLLTT